MADTLASDSSFSESSRPTIYSCRWAWCRQSFFTNAELVYHVVHEHVRKSIPVRRRDISLLRRVEGVVGETMSSTADLPVPGVSGTFSSQRMHDLGTAADHDGPSTGGTLTSDPPSQAHQSGLPAVGVGLSNEGQESIMFSGPPNPISQAVQEPDSLHGSHSDSQSIPQSFLTPPSPVIVSPARGQDPLRDVETNPPFPSFASLTSPSKFTRFPSIPPSPSFGSQVFRDSSSVGVTKDSDLMPASSLATGDDFWNRNNSEDQEPIVVRDLSTGDEPDQQSHGPLDSEMQRDVDILHDTSNDKSQKEESSSQAPVTQSWMMELKTQRPVPSQLTTHTQTQGHTQSTTTDSLQTQSSIGSPPVALLTQAQRQTWYQASPPYSLRKHSSSSSVANGSGPSVASPLSHRKS